MYSLISVKQRRFWCLYSISICVLSGCGGNTVKPTSKQNSCRFFLSLSLFLLLLSLSLSLPPHPLLFSFHSFSFYLPSDSLFPPSPGQPVAQLQQCLGKADCGIPGKPLRESREGGGGEHLAQHIYSTADSFSNIERNNARVILYFSYCQQTQECVSPSLRSSFPTMCVTLKPPKTICSYPSYNSIERVAKKKKASD